jgi:hypothetical protein
MMTKFNKNWLRFDAKDIKAGDEGLRHLSYLMDKQKSISTNFEDEDQDEDDDFVSLDTRNFGIASYKELNYVQIKCKQNNEYINNVFQRNTNNIVYQIDPSLEICKGRNLKHSGTKTYQVE